ncbi:hypothetical protein BN2476_250067 [Paraburkholderia piptadeniae]|uniref:Uncharacterized protein n=1 Tax=Paraburkholderia piptadeniae TaxID=1701573 RepID=A0A1N7S070_9BURK|nr:hypothetical protein BN2476_250067 [Paraburkholderia piptadeniae]
MAFKTCTTISDQVLTGVWTDIRFPLLDASLNVGGVWRRFVTGMLSPPFHNHKQLVFIH